LQPPVRLSLSDLAAAGQLILDTYVQQIEGQGVTVPSRRSVTPGNGAQGVAWDGEEFNVGLATIHQGQPGAPFSGTQNAIGAVLFAQWSVLLLRKIPILSGNNTGKAMVPSASKINVAGLANLADIGAMTQAALAIHAAYTFNDAGVGQALDEVVAMGPQGGLVGVRLLFSASLT
jgi:hypothetical protein